MSHALDAGFFLQQIVRNVFGHSSHGTLELFTNIVFYHSNIVILLTSAVPSLYGLS